MRENLLKEKHSGGLAGHFGHDKTFSKLWENEGFVSTQKGEGKHEVILTKG
jgi:hypothetical protein